MIFIGIGSNLSSKFGNRIKNINLAISMMEKVGINLLKKSNFYETFSQPNKSDPKFINIVVSIKTQLPPIDLMHFLISIEEKLERKRKKKNDPRTCDLDIIDYNGIVKNYYFDNFELKLPHAKLEYRNFVLYPLMDISPNWSHPKTKKNIKDLINNIKLNNNEITKLSENDIKQIC